MGIYPCWHLRVYIRRFIAIVFRQDWFINNTDHQVRKGSKYFGLNKDFKIWLPGVQNLEFFSCFHHLHFHVKVLEIFSAVGRKISSFVEDTEPATEGQMIKASADLNLKSFRTSHSSGSWCKASISKSRGFVLNLSFCSSGLNLRISSALTQRKIHFCKAIPHFELSMDLGFPGPIS